MLDMILKAKVTGLSEELSAEDLEKGFKQIVYIEEKTIKKVPTGDLTDHVNRKCKSLLVLPKTSLGQVLLLEVEQSVVTGGFKADIYYRIKAIHKV